MNVGAHLGSEAIILTKLAGPNGRTFLFEPQPLFANLVLKNLFMNDVADRSTIINKGCGIEPRSAFMEIFPGNRAASKVHLDVKNP